MKSDELIKKILNKEIASGTGIRVITPNYSTEYYFWGNWFGTKDGDKPLDNIELYLCDSQVTFEIIEERPEEIEELNIKGNPIMFGSMEEWLDFPLTNNEQKICSAIENIGINQNRIIKVANYLLKKEDSK